MTLSRRDFLKIMGGGAAALTFSGVMLQGCKRAIEKAAQRTHVIWIQGQSCSGCSVSILNSVTPDIASVITKHISLDFHQTLMGGTGDTAVNVLRNTVTKQRKDYVLVIEGSIPTKAEEFCTLGEVNGHHMAFIKWAKELGKNAKAVLTFGSCASFGGIPAALPRDTKENPTGAKPVSDILPKATIVNVPGCPPHPDWMVGTIVHFLLKGAPKLDDYNRPLLYYGKTVHEQCEHLSDYKRGKFAKHWGDEGCLYLLGCLGMDTGCDIPVRKWVDGANSCTGCGSGCIGCTEDVFPDTGKRGLYKHLTASAGEIELIENPEIREAVFNLKRGGVING